MYIPSTRKIISSYDDVFDEKITSALAYMSRPYSEAMAMCPSVTYTPCATSSRGETGDIIAFAQFEEGNILTKLVTIQKALTNTMKIQLCYHYLTKKKWM